MGLMHFVLARRDRLLPHAIGRSYLAGADDVPWNASVLLTDEGILVDREENDSGCFWLPWQVDGHGSVMLGTGTLIERDQPYQLEVELARGMLNRMRNQLGNWQMAGMQIDDQIIQRTNEATRLFTQAAISQDNPERAADESQKSLVATLDLGAALATAYSQQVLAIRQRQTPKLAVLLGGNLEANLPDESLNQPICAAFNTAQVPCTWRIVEAEQGVRDWSIPEQQIAWCQYHNLRIYGGPMIRFEPRAVPDWMMLFDGDFENLADLSAEYVQTVVTRYRNRVNLWNCAAGLNTTDMFHLSEDQRLKLAARLIEAVRVADPRAPIVITFDQPWCEYLAKREMDLPPLHFADTLARAEIGLAGFAIEINLGSHESGTAPRDPLELSRQIDRWSSLGLPIIVQLSWQIPQGSSGCGALQSLVERTVPLLLAKQAVQGVFLQSWPFSPPAGAEPNSSGELFKDASCEMLQQLTAIRQQYVM